MAVDFGAAGCGAGEGVRGAGAWSLEDLAVRGAEEAVWAPSVGLKGILDVCLEGVMRPAGRVQGVEEIRGVLPLELKTGKALDRDHRTQVRATRRR